MTGEEIWKVIGFIGQGLFASRFIVQWIASEVKKRSVVPLAFWYLSLAGGAILFAYAIYIRNEVFITGQGAGLIVYARNLILIRRTGASHSGTA